MPTIAQPSKQMLRVIATSCVLASCISATCLAASADSKSPVPPEIFFLGDSHLSFGAGKAFQEFFENFEQNCKSEEHWMGLAESVAKRRFALMGVKSTALHTWVSRHRRLKRMVCVPDPKWPVNARLYGFPHHRDGNYVQLGKDKSFPFCRKNQSALEALLQWSKPKLLIMYFMGNTIQRWARTPASARRDVNGLMQQLPKDTACVFMTTSPVYKRKHNKERVQAQNNIAKAMADLGPRCHFVPMLTPETVSAIEGRSKYFRRRSNGRVKDPYHPNIDAARRLLSMRRQPICRAVLDAMRPSKMAGKKDDETNRQE